MCEKEWETIEVEIDADLVAKAAEILKPMGLTPQDYFQMCINFMGDPANRELVTELLLAWLAEENIDCKQKQRHLYEPQFPRRLHMTRILIFIRPTNLVLLVLLVLPVLLYIRLRKMTITIGQVAHVIDIFLEFLSKVAIFSVLPSFWHIYGGRCFYSHFIYYERVLCKRRKDFCAIEART